MSVSLKILGFFSIGLLAGCSSQPLVHVDSPATAELVVADKPVLYPARFSLQLHGGVSGALLPENLDSQLEPLLKQLVDWQQVTRVVVVGHTDAEGSAKSNLLLSLRRANAVADKLQDHGIAAGVLEVDGRGEEAPIADNNSISGRKLNRRIEILAEGLSEAPQKIWFGQRN
ncbi:OmpA family protein [bacterium SCSIO 12696]|nr:OmpA family protein [bacterium SCSIO 12696]